MGQSGLENSVKGLSTLSLWRRGFRSLNCDAFHSQRRLGSSTGTSNRIVSADPQTVNSRASQTQLPVSSTPSLVTRSPNAPSCKPKRAEKRSTIPLALTFLEIYSLYV